MKKRMKQTVAFLLLLCLVLSQASTAAAKNSYKDMPGKNHWSYDALIKAVENGLLHGSKGYLNPKGVVTRAQFAMVLSRVFGATEFADVSGYADIDSNASYKNAMAQAVTMGIFSADENDQLYPLKKVTRQEAFDAIARVFEITGGTKQSLSKYKDKDKIASDALETLAAMSETGYIKGSKGLLNPNGKLTRAELVQVLSKVVEQYLSTSGTYTELAMGNVMINTKNVTIKDTTVKGDLIVGDGAGDSDITLDHVTIEGHLLVRGGGANSINLVNNSRVGSVLVNKTASGAIRVKTEEGCKVDVVYINDGKDDVIIEGVFNQVVIKTDTTTVLKNAEVNVVSVVADGASLKLAGNSSVQIANIKDSASKSVIEVEKEATVKKLDSSAPEVAIRGDGRVIEADVSGDNTKVDTKNTELTVQEGATGVSENGSPITATGKPVITGEKNANTQNETTAGSSDTGSSYQPSTPIVTPTPTNIPSDTAEVANETELIEAVNADHVNQIVIKNDITLTNPLTITKNVEILADTELTIAERMNLTFDVGKAVNGVSEQTNFLIHGTLNISKDSTFFNYSQTHVGSNGALKNSGSYVDISGLPEKESTKLGLLQSDSESTLYNEGTFVISSRYEAHDTKIQLHGGKLTNNGEFRVVGGSIESKAEFHNAGHMEINDIYSDTDRICSIEFGNTLTNDSKWIDYAALVYNETALYRAVDNQNKKVNTLGENDATKGFELYNQIKACNSMTIQKYVTINRADLWVEETQYNGNVNEKITIKIDENATIQFHRSTLHVKGILVNKGKISLGQLDDYHDNVYGVYGDLQVWPRGVFTNEGNVDRIQGTIYRMDDMKPDSDNIDVVTATIEGKKALTLVISDLAIVHSFAGLKQAVTRNYERIDIMRHEETKECDIVVNDDLEIDADMYIEWGNGIKVDEGVTLSFIGDNHWILNNADLMVSGNLTLGEGYRLENTAKIQVGGQSNGRCTFTNNGVIDNRNYIEILQLGTFTNNGTMDNSNTIEVKNGEFNGTGVVYASPNSKNTGVTGNVAIKVHDFNGLKIAMDNAAISNIVITGNIDLTEDLTVKQSISIGSKNESGTLNTKNYKIKVGTGCALDVLRGGFIISNGGNVVNQGEIAFEDAGGLRIEEGGKLETETDIIIKGYLDLYNVENSSRYITGSGKIVTYPDRAVFMEKVFGIMYEYDSSTITSVTPSAISRGATIASPNDIEYKVNEVYQYFVNGKDKLDDNSLRHYAYAAMIENEIGLTAVDDLNTIVHDPYTKVTYAYAHSIFETVAKKLKLDQTDSVTSFFTDMKNSDELINDFGDTNPFQTLFENFYNALDKGNTL